MPSSVSGKPVDSSGSTNPDDDGNSAQRAPVICPLQNDNSGANTNPSTGSAAANCLANDGNLANSRCQPGAPSAKPNSAARSPVAVTPALVMPLLNFSTQTQPPSNT